jgi:hypothetical protein
MTVVTADRRGAPRVKVSLPVRLRRLDSKHPGDICTTLNTSRDGLHLLTFAAHYLHERKVRVVRNFRPNDPANHEEIGDVVRIEKRGGGEWGVAIRIATPATSHSRQKTRF